MSVAVCFLYTFLVSDGFHVKFLFCDLLLGGIVWLVVILFEFYAFLGID